MYLKKNDLSAMIAMQTIDEAEKSVLDTQDVSVSNIPEFKFKPNKSLRLKLKETTCPIMGGDEADSDSDGIPLDATYTYVKECYDDEFTVEGVHRLIDRDDTIAGNGFTSLSWSPFYYRYNGGYIMNNYYYEFTVNELDISMNSLNKTRFYDSSANSSYMFDFRSNSTFYSNNESDPKDIGEGQLEFYGSVKFEADSRNGYFEAELYYQGQDLMFRNDCNGNGLPGFYSGKIILVDREENKVNIQFHSDCSYVIESKKLSLTKL